MEISGLLPIGSVILLCGGKKRLMIYGIKQVDTETKKEYDYIGVPYPEGNMGNEGHFFFNHEDIERIFYLGLNDAERQSFISRLEQFYNQRPGEANGGK